MERPYGRIAAAPALALAFAAMSALVPGPVRAQDPGGGFGSGEVFDPPTPDDLRGMAGTGAFVVPDAGTRAFDPSTGWPLPADPPAVAVFPGGGTIPVPGLSFPWPDLSAPGEGVVPPFALHPPGRFGDAGRCCLSCICGGEETGGLGIGIPPIPGGVPGGPVGSGAGGTGPGASAVSIGNAHAPRTYATTVALRDAGGAVRCSGVLVSPGSVLTAAHCTCGPARPVYAFFGDSPIPSAQAAGGVVFSLPLKTTPDRYAPGFCARRADWLAGRRTDYPAGDLALMHLDTPLPRALAALILPVEPRGRGQPFGHVYGAGFGRADGFNVAGKKHRARFVAAPRLCTAATGRGCRAGAEMIVVAHPDAPAADSCFADSGGPVFGRRSDDGGTGPHAEAPSLLAVTSRGLLENRPGHCGRGAINTSVETPAVRRWLATRAQGSPTSFRRTP